MFPLFQKPSLNFLGIFGCCRGWDGLNATNSVLLVNVPVALLFHAVFEDHGDAEYENHVYADDAEGGGEDSVQVGVGK